TPQMTNGSVISAARGGLLAFGGGASPGHLVWFSREGQRLGAIDSPAPAGNPTLSPDQKQLLVQSQNGDAPGDIWLVDLQGGARTRVAADASVPLWSP